MFIVECVVFVPYEIQICKISQICFYNHTAPIILQIYKYPICKRVTSALNTSALPLQLLYRMVQKNIKNIKMIHLKECAYNVYTNYRGYFCTSHYYLLELVFVIICVRDNLRLHTFYNLVQ